MLLKWTILTLSAGFLLASCSYKGNASRHNLDLLTSSPWKYEKAGFRTDDDDDDEVNFDALDPRIAGAERDYSIVFRPDGTGFQGEGKAKAKHSGNPDSLPFLWSFQNNDSTFYFQDQYYKIKTLTNSKFIIYADQTLGGVSSRYIIILKH